MKVVSRVSFKINHCLYSNHVTFTNENDVKSIMKTIDKYLKTSMLELEYLGFIKMW